jgi:N-dimethylarginine dimethylaminohydrolase
MMDNCFHNWGELSKVLVGDVLPASVYEGLPTQIKNCLVQITEETQEDLNNMCSVLESHGVKVVRPNVRTYMENEGFTLAEQTIAERKQLPGQPFAVRNHLLRWHDKIFVGANWAWENYGKEALNKHTDNVVLFDYFCASDVFRLGKDLLIDTENKDNIPFVDWIKKYRNFQQLDVNIHTASIGGHSDSSVCPIKPGLLLTRYEVDQYSDTFKGWEIHKLPHYMPKDLERYHRLWEDFSFKLVNEPQQEAVDFIKQYLTHWIGYSQETTFEVNMLHINPTTVITSHTNDKVTKLLNNNNIEVIHCPLRHKYFWDGGSHCVTFDIDRKSEPEDLFNRTEDLDFGELWRE